MRGTSGCTFMKAFADACSGRLCFGFPRFVSLTFPKVTVCKRKQRPFSTGIIHGFYDAYRQTHQRGVAGSRTECFVVCAKTSPRQVECLPLISAKLHRHWSVEPYLYYPRKGLLRAFIGEYQRAQRLDRGLRHPGPPAGYVNTEEHCHQLWQISFKTLCVRSVQYICCTGRISNFHRSYLSDIV